MPIEVIKNPDAVPIMPVTMLCDTSLGDVAPPFPRGAFSMLISAKPGSGKTTMLCTLLENKAYYKRKYDSVYAFIPQNSIDSLPQKSLLRRHDKIYNDLSWENLDKVIKKCRESAEEGSSSLIVIDDQLHALKNNDILQSLEFALANRRHMRTSTIISTQVYNSFPLILRKCLSHVVLFKLGNGREQASVVEECFPGIRKEDAEELLRMAHKTKHDFLLIDLREGRFFNSKLDELKIIEPNK